MTGTLYGVGLGPGDPELITRKAARLLQTCPVIAYPQLAGAASFARAIAADLLPAGRQEIVMDVPMTIDRAPAQAAYDRGAVAFAEALEAGLDVAARCEGDPFFYGSFMYLYARLSDRFPVEVVPGGTSLTACAGQAARPLVARNDVMTILPGPLDDDALLEHLRKAETLAASEAVTAAQSQKEELAAEADGIILGVENAAGVHQVEGEIRRLVVVGGDDDLGVSKGKGDDDGDDDN